MSARRLAWAREASGGRVSPTQLIVQTQFWDPQRPELNLQEAEVLWLLGFNVVDRWPEVRQKYDFMDPGGHHWVQFGPNLTREDIDNQIRPPAQATRAAPRPTLFNFSDEITSPPIDTDKAALRHFHAWLQERNVRPGELGVKALGDVVPIESPAMLRQRQKQEPKTANRIFYYTARFRQAAATERLRWLTERSQICRSRDEFNERAPGLAECSGSSSPSGTRFTAPSMESAAVSTGSITSI